MEDQQPTFLGLGTRRAHFRTERVEFGDKLISVKKLARMRDGGIWARKMTKPGGRFIGNDAYT